MAGAERRFTPRVRFPTASGKSQAAAAEKTEDSVFSESRWFSSRDYNQKKV